MNVLVVTYFGNGTEIKNWVSKRKAISYLNKPNIVIPDETDTVSIRGVGGIIFSVPRTIYFFVQKAFVPKDKPPTKTGLYFRDNATCAYCGLRISRTESTVDHIVPKSRGGADTWENLVLSCRDCNCRKDNRTPREAGMKLLFKPFKPY